MRRTVFALLAAGLLGLLGGPLSAQTSGPTVAPDLLSVTDVTVPGTDFNGSGTNDTTAVFTFDEAADVVSCCAGFQLVHVDTTANEPLTAIDVLAGDGTTQLTIAFEGRITAAETARGTVDANVVKAAGGPDSTNNAPMAADVAGATDAPDLVSVRQDLNTLLFEFDQSIFEDDDVVQSTSGLRFYTAEDPTTNDYGAQTVERVDDFTLRAVFDTPPGVSVADAVAAYATQGTVVGADVDDDGTFEPNELDEVLVGEPINSSVTCPPATVDETDLPDSWTQAPDLQFVGNFRQGPYTPELEPTTCVDYDFDTVVYLGGGNRTSFHLVPVDGGPVLDATGLMPDSDEEGDDRIIVQYLGLLEEADFARGYLDSEVVTANANGDGPYNVVQAEPVSNDGNSLDPDLVSVRQDLNTLLYTFDQSIAEDDDVIQSTSGLRFYTAQDPAIDYGAVSVAMVDDFTLRAVFDLPAGTTVADAVGGYVQQGTVVGADRDNDGTFEPNELDEVRVGDPINPFVTCPPSTVDETGLPESWTQAPDLQFAGNFRQGPYTPELEPTTCVDYDFDTAAYLGGGNRTSFHLVPVDGGPVLDATGLVPDSDEEGDDKVIVQYLGLLDEADFARGYVDGEVVTANANGDGPYNVLHADAISNEGNSDDPDLETVSEKSDNKLYFEFDEDLDREDVVQDTAGLRFYTVEGDVYTASRVYPTNRDDVLVAKFDLPKGVSARDAVGGIVTQGTVVAPDDDGDGAKEAISPDEVRKSDGNINKDTVEVID